MVLVTPDSPNRAIFIKIHHYIRSLERESTSSSIIFNDIKKKRSEIKERRNEIKAPSLARSVCLSSYVAYDNRLVVSPLNRDISSRP